MILINIFLYYWILYNYDYLYFINIEVHLLKSITFLFPMELNNPKLSILNGNDFEGEMFPYSQMCTYPRKVLKNSYKNTSARKN